MNRWIDPKAARTLGDYRVYTASDIQSCDSSAALAGWGSPWMRSARY